MPNTLIKLNYQRCNPAYCDHGICIAAAACPLKLIAQEEAFAIPMANPALCKGCAKCVNACPLRALELI